MRGLLIAIGIIWYVVFGVFGILCLFLTVIVGSPTGIVGLLLYWALGIMIGTPPIGIAYLIKQQRELKKMIKLPVASPIETTPPNINTIEKKDPEQKDSVMPWLKQSE